MFAFGKSKRFLPSINFCPLLADLSSQRSELSFETRILVRLFVQVKICFIQCMLELLLLLLCKICLELALLRDELGVVKLGGDLLILLLQDSDQ